MSRALASILEHYDRLVVLDVETSGLDPEKHDVIEVAALLVDYDGQRRMRVVTCLNTLVSRPRSKPLPRGITGLTGITDDMLVKEGMQRSKVARALAGLLTGSRVLLAAHNVQFDVLFVKALLQKERYSLPGDLALLDTLTVFRDRSNYPHSLSDAVAAYGLTEKVRNTHRALSDALAVLEVLKAMAQERDNLSSYVNVIGYNPQYGITGQRLPGIKYVPQPYRSRRPRTSVR